MVRKHFRSCWVDSNKILKATTKEEGSSQYQKEQVGSYRHDFQFWRLKVDPRFSSVILCNCLTWRNVWATRSPIWAPSPSPANDSIWTATLIWKQWGFLNWKYNVVHHSDKIESAVRSNYCHDQHNLKFWIVYFNKTILSCSFPKSKKSLMSHSGMPTGMTHQWDSID